MTETEIAARQGWRLVRRGDKGADGWQNLRLYRLGENLPKRCFWVGVKNGVMAKNRDAAIMFKHYPGLAAWAIEAVGQ